MGAARRKIGKIQGYEAWRSFKQGRKLEAAAVLEAKGFAALDAGNFDEAKSSFTRAAQIAPEFHSVRQISEKLEATGTTPDQKQEKAVTQEIQSQYGPTPPVAPRPESYDSRMMEQRPLSPAR